LRSLDFITLQAVRVFPRSNPPPFSLDLNQAALSKYSAEERRVLATIANPLWAKEAAHRDSWKAAAPQDAWTQAARWNASALAEIAFESVVAERPEPNWLEEKFTNNTISSSKIARAKAIADDAADVDPGAPPPIEPNASVAGGCQSFLASVAAIQEHASGKKAYFDLSTIAAVDALAKAISKKLQSGQEDSIQMSNLNEICVEHNDALNALATFVAIPPSVSAVGPVQEFIATRRDRHLKWAQWTTDQLEKVSFTPALQSNDFSYESYLLWK
jgi:hypothetical protein